MSALSIAAVALMVVITSFLSGVFGMAGGMILMGGLLFLMPVSSAMVLHGFVQITSNASRSLMWRAHIDWRIVLRFCAGLAIAGTIFSFFRFTPDERLVLIALGVVPFLALAVPAHRVPQAERRGGAELCGFLCTVFQLLSGVSGPTLDVFFVKGKMDRRAVIATKAACQVFSHFAKLIYFGMLLTNTDAQAAPIWVVALCISLAISGTSMSRIILERLSDHSFRRYTQWIVGVIGAAYLTRGIVAFL